MFNVLLQVLDDGRITDSQGRTVDFKNTILILTSNLGSEYILNGINADGTIEESAKEQVRALLRRTFRPEFLNRLDEIVFYKPLTKENVTKIIDLQIAKLNDRLADQQIRCELTPAAKAAIVDAAYDPQYGARPLRRYVQHTVETMLSKRLLRGDVTPGQTVTVDADFAVLTGKLSGIGTLKAQGVEKIVFVTKDATSAFRLADLLEKGAAGETYKLTHDGKTAAFTAGGQQTDISDILMKA